MSPIACSPIAMTTSTTIGSFVENLANSEVHSSTVVIVCSTKSRFSEQIAMHMLSSTAIAGENAGSVHPSSSDQCDLVDGQGPTDSETSSSALLDLSLRLLAMSARTTVAFCPNILAFRAYLSSLPPKPNTIDGPLSKIIVVDMLAMHHGTSEYTIQGLSRSFALLASVSHHLRSQMEIFECTDFNDPANPDRGPRLWHADVPLLSGSVKIGEAGQGWATRTTSIENFAKKWFRFV